MPKQAVTLDKATVLISIFIIVEEIMKQPAVVQSLKRPGPKPLCSDDKLITVALYQELVGDPREDHFFRMQAGLLQSYFPDLPSRSRYNRRKRALAWIILLVRTAILSALVDDHTELIESGAIDSVPVPVTGYKRPKNSNWSEVAAYGRCAAKAMKFYGCKLTTIVNPTGIILDFGLAAANHYDNQIVLELLAQGRYTEALLILIGDKAYNAELLQDDVQQMFGIILKAPKKDNQLKDPTDKRIPTKAERVMRLMGELVNSQLQEQLHLSKHYAKSVHGLFTRIAAKVTAHTVGIAVNLMLGRKPLALAGLAY